MDRYKCLQIAANPGLPTHREAISIAVESSFVWSGLQDFLGLCRLVEQEILRKMFSQVPIDVHLINLLHFLVSKLFVQDSFCTIVYYDQSLNETQNQPLHVVERELLLHQIVTVWIAADSENAEELLEKAIEIGCQSYITLTDELVRFFAMKLEIKDRTGQRMRDRNFVIFSENALTFTESAAFREATNFYPNVWILSPFGKKGYKLFTQNYSRADSLELYAVNSLDVSAFSDKLFDLGGRDVKVAVLDYGPYCLTTHVGENRGNADSLNSTLRGELHIEGIEGNLIVEFCKARKCNLKLLPLGPNSWGSINENGTGDGMLYATYAKQTELSFCSTSVSWVYDFLDGSQPVASTAMKLLVPKAKLIPTFLTPVYPFDSKLWIAILVMLITMTVVLYGIAALNSFRVSAEQPSMVTSFFDTISIYLDQSIFLNLSTFSYCILVGFIIMSGVVLSNSYAGGLASVLTVPRYEKSLETTHDFATSPYRWAAPSIAWTFTIADADSADLQAVVRKISVFPDLEQLYRRTLRGDIGVGVELLNSQKIYPGPYIREDNVNLFELLRESTYYDYTGGVSQRGWPLMASFNKFILEVVQGGFAIYWEREMLRKFLSYQLEMAMERIVAGRKPNVGVQVLDVEHILGPLYIMLIGSAVAIVVFVLEVCWRTIQAKLADRTYFIIRTLKIRKM